MTHCIAASNNQSIADASRPSNANPTGRGRPTMETGVVIARIFDLLEGSGLEPFAAEIAWRMVNGAVYQPHH